ncbi:uncharacterized protein N7496_002647 [Penicillium cataractarum]|uniref:Uncharacterized protein n=1 Tax=Penicillium cataractarum TaxID=2100454 RepID=A0A9W9SM64_9EURO|nr:uncharacterized protein N7496_002647 [Penicillium cataractarum]KAJ5380219.1 hypothetical protein N7496_002647 [Penicillium cataractarum]
MGDALRPSDDEFKKVLQQSLNIWSSYLDSGSEDHPLPRQAMDLRSLVGQTPPFLGDNLASLDEKISFACEEKQWTQGEGSLVVNCRSAWRTSKGICDIQPRILPKQLLLGFSRQLTVSFSEDSPLSDWPEVQGLSGYDKGNYLSILFFAWAYILSARWVELLGRSEDHECHIRYAAPEAKSPPLSEEQSKVQIDLGEGACEEEALR